MRRAVWIGVGLALVAGVVAGIALLTAGSTERLPERSGAAPEELAYLPREFPDLPGTDLDEARVSEQGEGLRLKLQGVVGPGEPREQLFVLAERLRDAGWQVSEEPSGNRMSFTGFGWTGEARPEDPGEGVVVTLEGRTP